MKIFLDDLKSLSKNIGTGVDANLIKVDSTFKESGLDSLDTYDLVACLEEKYGVSITNQEFNQLKTYKDLLDCSNNALSKKEL